MRLESILNLARTSHFPLPPMPRHGERISSISFSFVIWFCAFRRPGDLIASQGNCAKQRMIHSGKFLQIELRTRRHTMLPLLKLSRWPSCWTGLSERSMAPQSCLSSIKTKIKPAVYQQRLSITHPPKRDGNRSATQQPCSGHHGWKPLSDSSIARLGVFSSRA